MRNLRVFLSHRADQDFETAVRVARDLESKQVATWYAPRDVDPGTTWPQAIERGLLSASHVAILLSTGTLESRGVHLELQMAEMLHLENKVQLVPVILEKVELPPWLAVLQWIDFTRSYADGIAALTQMFESSRSAATVEARTAETRDADVHRVCAGERIDHLTQRFLGDGRDWRGVLDVNPGLDPIRLAAGQRVVAPPRPTQ